MKHILSSGLIAGLAAGLLCALLQLWLVEPQILLAEKYETGELVHFGGVKGGSADQTAMPMQQAADAGTAPAVTMAPAGDEDSQPQRYGLTVLFSILTYAGYGLLVTGGMMAAGNAGYRIGSPEALLWGLAGFLAFQALPAIGLPPELPGVPAVDLGARQLWWGATAVSAVVGLSLIGYGKGLLSRLVGAAVLLIPQVVGAPEVEAFAGQVPPELAAMFAARTLGVGLITWLTLGFCVGRLLNKPTI